MNDAVSYKGALELERQGPFVLRSKVSFC
jgi:hypothetical protein